MIPNGTALYGLPGLPLARELEESKVRLKEAAAALEAREKELEQLRAELETVRAEGTAGEETMKKLERELEEQREAAGKDRAALEVELAALRRQLREKDEQIRRQAEELAVARSAGGGNHSELRQQLEARERALREAREEANRASRAHEIDREVFRLEGKLREQQQAALELAREEMVQREKKLVDEIVWLRGQLEQRDVSMRELAESGRKQLDLSEFRNPMLEKWVAAQASAEPQASSAGQDAERSGPQEKREAAPLPGTLKLPPLPAVGEDIIPRYTSPRPYYHELPREKARKSRMLSFGWILALGGIAAMLLSPSGLVPVYGPLTALALLIGMGLYLRRRTPMVVGLIFLTLLIPAMIWFGVEQAQFEGLAPDLSVEVPGLELGAR